MVELAVSVPPAATRMPVHEPAEVPAEVKSTGDAPLPLTARVPSTMSSTWAASVPRLAASVVVTVMVVPAATVRVTPALTCTSRVMLTAPDQVVSLLMTCAEAEVASRARKRRGRGERMVGEHLTPARSASPLHSER